MIFSLLSTMLTKNELIHMISELITPPAETWKNDPFELLVKKCPKDLFEKYVDTPNEDSIPSTSDDVRTVNADVRIYYSQILGGLYLDLANLLKSERANCSDEYQLLSLQDVTLVRKSFEFFLLTGILPFMEPGAGLGAASRSTFIKSWKLYDGNKETCIEKLEFAAKVIINLLESNESLIGQFLTKFIDDVLAVRFQLLQLKIDKYELNFAELVSKLQIDVLFGSLMFLTQDKKTAKTPMWLKVACGKQMTKILVGKDGLSYLLQYYRERAGDTWTDNLPLTKQVSWHLATVPKMFRHPLNYHEIISNQFFELLWSQKIPEQNTLNVFINYVEELHTRFALNANLTVFDKILNFWEVLDKKIQDKTVMHSEKVENYSPNFIRNLQLLSQLQLSADVKRTRALSTCLFACVEQIPYIKDILKSALDSVLSIGYIIYQFVMTPSHRVALEKKFVTSSKIQEIGGDSNGNDTPFDEMWLHGIESTDEGVARRLETAFFVIDNVLTSAQIRPILEMMNMALDDFLKVSEKEREDDQARFVQLDGAKLFSSSHAHLVVGACFERIINLAQDSGFSQEECVQLLRIAESILNNCTGKFMRMANRKRNVDVFRMTPTEKKEFECSRDSAKMCLPMISTVFMLTQTTTRMHDVHIRSMEAMANFTKAADAFPSEDVSFNLAVDEAKKLLRDLKIDVNQVNAPTLPQRTDRQRYNQQVDVCNEWIEELHDDEPAIKGGALMQIARVFRNRTYHCQRLFEYGVFDAVKDMVADDDSYVYLSAINCLCEMGLYNKNMFEDTIEYYEEMSNQPQKDTKMIIRVGRVAEAIGKLLLARGEISVTYFDRLATLFMKGIDEPEEILRASSCGAFGNLMIATRGRGSEKWLGQVFHKIVNIIRVDRSPLVRRSAADLIRHSLQSTGRDMLAILREHLLDLHREIRQLHRTDRDETVRLHAQLCLEEIEAALRQNQEDTERGYHRRIRF